MCFSKILFGDDLGELMNKKYPYIFEDGTNGELTLKDMFLKIVPTYAEEYFNPLTFILPFINTYSLIQPYKRNHLNLKSFKSGLNELIRTSKDTNSVRHKISKCDKLSAEQKL